MAFNPFVTFRRHLKYWMAGAVLLCMVTFVLCSGGMRGMGLDDVLLRIMPRHGEVVAKVNGTKYYYEEITELKNQRNLANDFMRELAKMGVERLTAIITDAKKSDKLTEEERFALPYRELCLDDLMQVLGRDPRFFHGGTKLDDIVEFILWRDLAKKNGVTLTNDVVDNLLRNSCHGAWWGMNLSDASREIQYKLRGPHSNYTDTMLRTAIRQEFGVQIIQMAMLARRAPGADNMRERNANIQVSARGDFLHIYLNTPLEVRIAPTPEQIGSRYRKMRTELTVDLLPVSLEAQAEKVKLPEDPKARLALLKDFYDQHARQQYNPALDTPGFTLPSRIEAQFLTAEPGMEYYRLPAKVATTLEKTPPIAINPLSPLQGALTWLAAPARWETKLQQFQDAERTRFERAQQDAYMGLVGRMDKYLTEKDPGKRIDAKLAYEKLYEIVYVRKLLPSYKNSASPLITPYYYSPGLFDMAIDRPAALTDASAGPTADSARKNNGRLAVPAASLVAGTAAGIVPFNGWMCYQSGAYDYQSWRIAPMAARDKVTRTEIGGGLMLARLSELSGGGPFAAAGLTYYAGLQPQYLPVAGYLETELQTKIEDDLAQRHVNIVMLDVKKQLEAIKGRDFAFPEKVESLRTKYSRDIVDKNGHSRTIPGLQFGETTQPRSEFDIELDEGLKPLRDSFDKYRTAVNQIEGRSGKPDMLREGDFAKLFFGSEVLGVGPLEPFMPKIWPPYVTLPKWRQAALAQKSLEQRLFDTAEKPFAFWKSKKLGSEAMPWDPKNASRLKLIENQYRMSQARANIMEEVQKLADDVKRAQRSEGLNLDQVMRELAKKNNTEVITLKKVAKLVENPDRGPNEPVTYGEYSLPRGRIPFAREDMVKQLLSLRNLTSSLKVAPEEEKQSKSTADSSAKLAKTELEDLDKLNAKLFSSDIAANPKSKVGQVQVLTNKPRTVYYIATVTAVHEPSGLGFFEGDILPQAMGKDNMPTTFAEQVQQTEGKDLWQTFVQQMRASANVEVSEQARKQFADDSQGQ